MIWGAANATNVLIGACTISKIDSTSFVAEVGGHIVTSIYSIQGSSSKTLSSTLESRDNRCQSV
jgi:hypothetical protein